MVLRPEDIEQREFGSALRGFDKAEVRAFLRRVAGEVRYLESEVEAVRGGPTEEVERPAVDLELPRLDTRPAPPQLPDEGPLRELPDLGAPGSQLPEPAVAPVAAPIEVGSHDAGSSTAGSNEQVAGSATPPSTGSHEIESDRFGALGERIANLLRNAQETAEQVRHQADSDAAQTRADAAAAGVELRTSADQYATQTRTAAAAEAEELRSTADVYSVEVHNAADADAAGMRAAAAEALSSAQAEATEIREHALADANEMRVRAAEELDDSRSKAATALSEAESEVVTLRRKTIDEGVASLAAREASVSEQEAEITARREQAMAELADARGQVSTLLQEARAQSEFIRQESEEIIRTKVRANMEQAQRRIDMLRTTETASKDRISAARKELESALARLDAEPAPGLPAGTEDLVLDEAQQNVRGNDALMAPLPDAVPADVETGDGIIDVETVDAPDRFVGAEDPVADTGDAFSADAEPQVDVVEVVDVEGAITDESPTNGFDPSLSDVPTETDVSEPGAFDLVDALEEADLEEPHGAEPAFEPTLLDLPSPETIAPPPPPPGFADDFVDPGVGQTVHGGSFFANRSGDTAGEIPPPPPPPGFDAPIGIDAPVFDTPSDVPAAPAADFDPLEGLIPDESDQDPATSGSSEPVADDPMILGEATASDVVSDINTPENEDALAKLVREAMQRAVDSARGNQN